VGSKGYTLAELLLALALAVVVVLTLLGLGLTALSGNQKSSDLLAAQSLAHQWLEEEIYGAQGLPGAAIWAASSDVNPYTQKTTQLGNCEYTAAYYASDVTDPGLPGLKKCRLRVSWWSGAEARQGYGRLYTEATRYVSTP
jgi:Tfp pilus assembly protein PilV